MPDMTEEEFLANYVEKHPKHEERGRLVVDFVACLNADGPMLEEGETAELSRCGVYYDPDTKTLYADVLFRLSGGKRRSIGSSIALNLDTFVELHEKDKEVAE